MKIVIEEDTRPWQFPALLMMNYRKGAMERNFLRSRRLKSWGALHRPVPWCFQN